MLSLLQGLLLGEKVELGDMRPVLADAERLLPQAPNATRPALLLFHILTNWLFAPENRSPGAEGFLITNGSEAFSPGPEALIVGTYTGRIGHWTLQEHAAEIDRYFSERVRRSGLHAPRILEAAAVLTLAERYRSEGDEDAARLLIARGVETDPANFGLREFEADWKKDVAIDWKSILIPRKENPDRAEAPAFT